MFIYDLSSCYEYDYPPYYDICSHPNLYPNELLCSLPPASSPQAPLRVFPSQASLWANRSQAPVRAHPPGPNSSGVPGPVWGGP